MLLCMLMLHEQYGKKRRIFGHAANLSWTWAEHVSTDETRAGLRLGVQSSNNQSTHKNHIIMGSLQTSNTSHLLVGLSA